MLPVTPDGAYSRELASSKILVLFGGWRHCGLNG